MVTYLLKNPQMIKILGMSGIILSMYSLGIFSGAPLPQALALDCNSAGAPALPSSQSNQGNPGYAVNWRVTSWLTFHNIPIGPSSWAVSGRLQEGANQNCFLETWRMSKVVFQSSRHSNRGEIIDRLDSAAANRHNLLFDENTNTVNNQYYAAYRLNTGGAAQDWSPMGLYGLLKSDKDGLNDSRGYLPTEWQVTGSF